MSSDDSYICQVSDAIEDNCGEPDLFIGVDHDLVTIHLGRYEPGGEVIRLDSARGEDFIAFFFAAFARAARNAARMEAEGLALHGTTETEGERNA